MISWIVSGGVRFGMVLMRAADGDGDGEVGGNALPCKNWVRATCQ